MNIATVVEFCPPRLGSDRRIFELLTRFPAEARVSFVVCPPSRCILGLLPFASVNQWKDDMVIREGVTAHYLAIPPSFRKVWRPALLGYILALFFVLPKVLKALRKTNPEIVVLNHPSAYTGLLGFVSSRILRRKVAVDFNDMIADYTVNLLHESGARSSKTWGVSDRLVSHLLTIVQNWIVVNSDMVFAPSTFIVEYARKIGATNICLVPNGVDANVFHPTKYDRSVAWQQRLGRIKQHNKLVVYMGRLDNWAGAQLILGCAKRLEDLRVKFVLAGEGSCETFDEALNVIFAGPVPYQQVPECLASADLVLVPMRDDIAGNAASPIKLFEAMAMMKPVIASATKGIRDAVRNNENGILLPFDEERWASTIRRMLRNPDQAMKLGENARRKVEKDFDWKVLATSSFEQLTRLVDNYSNKAQAT